MYLPLLCYLRSKHVFSKIIKNIQRYQCKNLVFDYQLTISCSWFQINQCYPVYVLGVLLRSSINKFSCVTFSNHSGCINTIDTCWILGNIHGTPCDHHLCWINLKWTITNDTVEMINNLDVIKQFMYILNSLF